MPKDLDNSIFLSIVPPAQATKRLASHNKIKTMSKYQKQQAKFNMHSHVNNRVLSLTKKGKSVHLITLCGKDQNILIAPV